MYSSVPCYTVLFSIVLLLRNISGYSPICTPTFRRFMMIPQEHIRILVTHQRQLRKRRQSCMSNRLITSLGISDFVNGTAKSNELNAATIQ
jgi:hypothetical protein